jgi:nucleotide-binding universal stress UspA family protein
MIVLIGVDESAFSKAAVEYVKGATWPKGTRFHVVSASPPVFIGPGEAAAPGAISELIQAQEKFHRNLADAGAAALKAAGLDAEARMVPTDPRGALIDEAKRVHADLVVVGSHGRSGIGKLLLGSVASHVVSHAPCSVLVVKRPH